LRFLYQIGRSPAKLSFGNKALGLSKLLRHHLPVPDTWLIPVDVKKFHDQDPTSFVRQLRNELEKHIHTGQSYAVRSSGELEDRADYSFAGQFATFLDVQGTEAIMDAVLKVWDSALPVYEGAYMKQTGQSNQLKGMGVILQEMVDVQWSGVAFSINPVTGRSETIIEGVRGKGDKLVQEGRTPGRWIHHQGTWGAYEEVQAPPREVLQNLVRDMHKLRKVFKGEVDVEWGWDGEQLWYLQCRRVSTTRFPTIYSNHISREVLPGMIKPLVWSVNTHLVNSAWIRLLSGMLGKLDIQPEDLSRAFYYRAYFNMGTLGALFRMMGLPRDSLESLMGRKDPSGKSSFKPSLKTMKYLPTMVGFLLTNLNLGRRFKRKILKLNTETEQVQNELIGMQPNDFHRIFSRLHALTSESAYWNIIVPLTMQITNRLLEMKMKKRGKDFNSLEFTMDFPELLDYDPKIHLDMLRETWDRIPLQQRLEISSYEALETLEEGHPLKYFLKDMESFIARFGHFSESGNDFSYMPWRENPDFVFQMICDAKGKERVWKPGDKVLGGKHSVPGRAYRRAGRFRLYREMISSSYTRTYGLFRILFLTTGKYFTEKGYLKEPGHVFYLTLEEHDRLLTGSDPAEISGIQEKINRVKEEMESYREISLPSVIYGEKPPPIAVSEENMLKGIPTSPGIFAGEVVVVTGYNDFNKEVDGKILVIPFSDVGWTPLLSRAGAIVSESGGILSHASILARELSIPAISSVDFACNIKDGKKATVDGNNGYLLLTEHANGNDIRK
jgi:pyruvate,water dikinase